MMIDGPAALSGVLWLIALALFGLVLYRLTQRRGHIGSAAAGTIYDIIHDDKRKAIEIVVADKAAARDFEHAADDDPPQSNNVN